MGDLLEPTTARDLMERLRPERLLHLAWIAKPGVYWTSPENICWVEATLRLLREFADHGGRRAVIAGSCAEYDWWSGSGLCVESSTPLRPATLYGISKDATRALSEGFAAAVGIELSWGRIFYLYGPGEPGTRLVPFVAQALLEGRPAGVGDGLQVRDFLHVDDVAEALVALLESHIEGPVNIGSGRGVAVRDVIELVARSAERPELVRFGARPPRAREPPSLIADVGRLQREVGFQPRIPLQAGIEETVAWWREALGLASVSGA
jgi:nucleoside-diphosphate-sugar epimerase